MQDPSMRMAAPCSLGQHGSLDNTEAKHSLGSGTFAILGWGGDCSVHGVCQVPSREFNLAGRTSMEMAQVDEIIDVIQDLLNAWYSLYHAKDSAGQEKFLETNIPTTMGQLEKKLESRGGQFMVGNAFSWADLHLFFYVTDMKLMANKAVDTNYPKIANLVQRVGSIPNIKAWVESRPSSVL